MTGWPESDVKDERRKLRSTSLTCTDDKCELCEEMFEQGNCLLKKWRFFLSFVPQSCWWSCDAFSLVRRHWGLRCPRVDAIYIPAVFRLPSDTLDHWRGCSVSCWAVRFGHKQRPCPRQFDMTWNTWSYISALPEIADICSKMCFDSWAHVLFWRASHGERKASFLCAMILSD